MRRPHNFAKSPPHFWLALHRTKVWWRFRKILWPSQNIRTLKLMMKIVASWNNLAWSMTEKKYICLTVLDILLSIQEPVGNLVLTRVLHNGDDFLNLLFAQLTSALVKINVSLEFRIKMSTNHRIICHVFFYNRKMTGEWINQT